MIAWGKKFNYGGRCGWDMSIGRTSVDIALKWAGFKQRLWLDFSTDYGFMGSWLCGSGSMESKIIQGTTIE